MIRATRRGFHVQTGIRAGDGDTPASGAAQTVEQLTARVAQLETINRELKEEKTAEKKKAIKPDEIERVLSGERPSDERLFKLYDEVKEQRARAEKAEAELLKITGEHTALNEKHAEASKRLDRIDMEAAVREAAPDAFVADLFDVGVTELAAHLGRDPKGGKYVPFREGKPWVDDKGKPVTLAALIDDMRPAGDHKLTGINRPSLFRPVDGKEPKTHQTLVPIPVEGAPRSLDDTMKEIRAERK